MTSPIYWHPLLYRLAMRLLYGRFFEARYAPVAELIPDGSSVHEVCAGDCRFYWKYLAGRKIRYQASDKNPVFVRSARSKGIDCLQLDLKAGSPPPADYIVIMASLYQFMPDHKVVVDRLLAASAKGLILTEPVVNLASSPNPLLRLAGRLGTNPGGGAAPMRFNAQSLDAFVGEFYSDCLAGSAVIAGGREKLYVLRRSSTAKAQR